jgi:hypothetical protein
MFKLLNYKEAFLLGFIKAKIYPDFFAGTFLNYTATLILLSCYF